MYKIIGADQREYGPVSADQIRQWIAEGRANGASLVQAEGATEWVPLSSQPEFADALSAQPARYAAVAQTPSANPTDLAEAARRRSVGLDIGLCVSRSWNLFKPNAGLLIGATVIFIVLVGAVSQVIGIFTRNAMQSLAAGNLAPGPILVLLLANIPDMALSALLTGGIYTILLKLARRQPTGMADLFAGFSGPAAQLIMAGIVVQLLAGLGFLLCIIPGVYLSTAWIFTVPLVVDRQLDFWSAMEVSRKGVNVHWWSVFCLLIVVALISLLGLLACCVGIIAALPIGLGALIYAYEDLSEQPDQPPVNRSKAWSYLVTNLLVLPGLGSVMAGWKRGYAQMFLAGVGFIVTLVALVRIVVLWAREFLLPNDPRLYKAAILGMAVFLASWCWSLMTSLAIFREKP